MRSNKKKEARVFRTLSLVGLLAAIVAIVVAVVPAGATRVAQVCPAYDSGKIDTPGAGSSLEITAPEGFLISGYCVKAGSAEQGEGPEFYPVDPPQETVTISHSSGKEISHYSVLYVEDEEEEPVEVEASVTFTEATCDNPVPSVTLGHQDHVNYLLHGQIAPGAWVEVTATAKDGFVLVGQTEWSHTFAEISTECQPNQPTPDAPPVAPETPAGGATSHHNEPHHNELPETL